MNKQYMWRATEKNKYKTIEENYENTQRIKSQNHRVWVVLKSHSLTYINIQHRQFVVVVSFFISFVCFSLVLFAVLPAFSPFRLFIRFCWVFSTSFGTDTLPIRLLYWVHVIEYDDFDSIHFYYELGQLHDILMKAT